MSIVLLAVDALIAICNNGKTNGEMLRCDLAATA
jgi:hypothetical protein